MILRLLFLSTDCSDCKKFANIFTEVSMSIVFGPAHDPDGSGEKAQIDRLLTALGYDPANIRRREDGPAKQIYADVVRLVSEQRARDEAYITSVQR
jgi:hypothetical protein